MCAYRHVRPCVEPLSPLRATPKDRQGPPLGGAQPLPRLDGPSFWGASDRQGGPGASTGGPANGAAGWCGACSPRTGLPPDSIRRLCTRGGGVVPTSISAAYAVGRSRGGHRKTGTRKIRGGQPPRSDPVPGNGPHRRPLSSLRIYRPLSDCITEPGGTTTTGDPVRRQRVGRRSNDQSCGQVRCDHGGDDSTGRVRLYLGRSLLFGTR